MRMGKKTRIFTGFGCPVSPNIALKRQHSFIALPYLRAKSANQNNFQNTKISESDK